MGEVRCAKAELPIVKRIGRVVRAINKDADNDRSCDQINQREAHGQAQL